MGDLTCFESFFWDVHIHELSIEENKFFIIERLLQEGNHQFIVLVV